MPCTRLPLVAVIPVLIAGCGPIDRQQSLEYRLQKAEGERDATQKRLEHERAKTAALSERVAAESRQGTLTRAEVAALKARLERLQGDYDQLVELLEGLARQPLQRPDVAASPLPVNVDQALQTFAARFAGRVWYDRGRAAISFANDRLFETGRDAVRPDAQRALSDLAGIAALTLPDEYEIIVVGHSDNLPITRPQTLEKHPSNWHLSVHRALAVKDVLASAGLPESRMGVMGYGPWRPLGSDQARNRRVEIFFVRKGEVSPRAPVHAAPIE